MYMHRIYMSYIHSEGHIFFQSSQQRGYVKSRISPPLTSLIKITMSLIRSLLSWEGGLIGTLPNTKHPCYDCLDLQPTQRSDCAIACTTSFHRSLDWLVSSAPSHVYSCYRGSRSTTSSDFHLSEEWQFSFPEPASGCTALSSKSLSLFFELHYVKEWNSCLLEWTNEWSLSLLPL